MKHLLLVAAVLFGYQSAASAGPDTPLHAKLVKENSMKGWLHLADMKCAQVTDDPEQLKCAVSMMFLSWNEPPEVYDQRATEADRTKSVDEATTEMQSNPQSFCRRTREVVDEMKKPDGQRAAKFMAVEMRGFLDKALEVCETTDPGSLTARLASLMPRSKIDAFIINLRAAQIQSENETCFYSLHSRTQTFSKRSENRWEYKHRDTRDNGCDIQRNSELIFDPESKEWTWSTAHTLAANVDPVKKCQIREIHEIFRSSDGAPAPRCKYFSSSD